MRYSFESAFAPYISGLIEQKHTDGFDYHSAEVLLKKFDTFCVSHFSEAKSIDRELVAQWAVIRATESKSYRNSRMYALRQLCLYMLSLGLEVYVPRNIGGNPKALLYVPSREEMICFFKELDVWGYQTKMGERMICEYKMLFRLYYCCGMRLSEGRLLKRENVDFSKGVLTILEAKGNKDRLVYLPEDGISVMRQYLRDIEMLMPNSPWLFPGNTADKAISIAAVERRFDACWQRLPFASNSSKHPTPHCLRHAFVVERLNEWMLNGIDIQEMFPYLCKHLGHEGIHETLYYYHLVDKAFAVIKQKDTISNRVIPEVQPYEEF
jgi:site-specific recombinase XerD